MLKMIQFSQIKPELAIRNSHQLPLHTPPSMPSLAALKGNAVQNSPKLRLFGFEKDHQYCTHSNYVIGRNKTTYKLPNTYTQLIVQLYLR